MFFLGLLSTPLPYLLLAAFYFFGFAMGVFNNSSGEETTKPVSTLTIPVETKPKTVEKTTFYFQLNDQAKIQHHAEAIASSDINTSYFSDTGSSTYLIRNAEISDFFFSGFRFSRPPPSV